MNQEKNPSQELDLNDPQDIATLFKKHGVKFSPKDIDEMTIGSKEQKAKKIKANTIDYITIMLKAVDVCKMDERMKTILRMRMWGQSPHMYQPLTCKDISGRTGVNIEIVENIEKAAKDELQDFLAKTSAKDIVLKFNKSQRGGNVLYDSKGRPITE